jgi:hypothetical protein
MRSAIKTNVKDTVMMLFSYFKFNIVLKCLCLGEYLWIMYSSCSLMTNYNWTLLFVANCRVVTNTIKPTSNHYQ